jgi:hypothetical protein
VVVELKKVVANLSLLSLCPFDRGGQFDPHWDLIVINTNIDSFVKLIPSIDSNHRLLKVFVVKFISTGPLIGKDVKVFGLHLIEKR